MQRPTRLSHDALVANLMTADFAMNESDALIQVGFLKDEDGKMYCENVLEHTNDAKNDDITIINPESLEYRFECNGHEIPMKHSFKYLGLSTMVHRVTTTTGVPNAEELIPNTKVTIGLHAYDKGKKLKTLFKGSYTIPERMHVLGHPRGPRGYMVSIFDKNMVFMYEGYHRITFQGDFSEM
jgi:hypothetical protein